MGPTRDMMVRQLTQGKNPEQKRIIENYFYPKGGCMSKGMTDEEFDGIVGGKLQSLNCKQKALDKIGLDESQVSEIAPVMFEGYAHEEGEKSFAKRGADGRWRSSRYQTTWLFFSSTQVYMYAYTFDVTSDTKTEKTEEYFYKDITNFSTATGTVEKVVFTSGGCMKPSMPGKDNIEFQEFAIVVPGDKFKASTGTQDIEASVQAMKAKLREKKG
jgi:hypothetical protein